MHHVLFTILMSILIYHHRLVQCPRIMHHLTAENKSYRQFTYLETVVLLSTACQHLTTPSRYSNPRNTAAIQRYSQQQTATRCLAGWKKRSLTADCCPTG
jgi:hypothetical protein